MIEIAYLLSAEDSSLHVRSGDWERATLRDKTLIEPRFFRFIRKSTYYLS